MKGFELKILAIVVDVIIITFIRVIVRNGFSRNITHFDLSVQLNLVSCVYGGMWKFWAVQSKTTFEFQTQNRITIMFARRNKTVHIHTFKLETQNLEFLVGRKQLKYVCFVDDSGICLSSVTCLSPSKGFQRVHDRTYSAHNQSLTSHILYSSRKLYAKLRSSICI